jgi:hypothetical protein
MSMLGRKRPAFGIVGQPVEATVASGGTRQVFDPAAYGFVPREQLRTDRPDVTMDGLIDASRRGDWPATRTPGACSRRRWCAWPGSCVPASRPAR